MTMNEQDISLSHYTPIKDVDDSCERTCAQLLVYSDDLHPSAVTDLLGISPTKYAARGEKSPPNSLGLAPIGRVNGWFLSSEEHVQSKDLRRHLNWLIGQLQPRASALRQLQAKPRVRMYVSCPWWSNDGGGGVSLWPEQMLALAALNLECTIVFADYSDEGGQQT
ncbi:MAG TPA: DUF4279 domain-containing protein [Terriglobales bacterium]|nr:DUF4279 domain-containing protein [Terriglobales bacterium]